MDRNHAEQQKELDEDKWMSFHDFVMKHPKLKAEMKDLGEDLKVEFESIGKRLTEYVQFFENPKYKAEVDAIKAKEMALLQKITNFLEFDAEGQKMWQFAGNQYVRKHQGICNATRGNQLQMWRGQNYQFCEN